MHPNHLLSQPETILKEVVGLFRPGGEVVHAARNGGSRRAVARLHKSLPGAGWSMALWTIGLFVALEGVTGQVIEPIFHGRSTGLTPIAIIMAATFWAWLSGPVGLVLATP